MLKPKVKVIGIENILEMNLKDIEKDINDRNFKNYVERSMKCEAMYIYSMSMSMYRVGRAALFRDVLPSTQAYTHFAVTP